MYFRFNEDGGSIKLSGGRMLLGLKSLPNKYTSLSLKYFNKCPGPGYLPLVPCLVVAGRLVCPYDSQSSTGGSPVLLVSLRMRRQTRQHSGPPGWGLASRSIPTDTTDREIDGPAAGRFVATGSESLIRLEAA